MIQITMREWVVLSYLTHYITTHGHAPTMRQIAKGCGFKSTSYARARLDDLEALGLITRQRKKARSVVLCACQVAVQPQGEAA